ncbi:hypothetical protein C8F04DRAFT_1102068 [Mycena alexandri]|uniref:F-box domain-containing protein n=1 Tax=Mycena alexandri TaxID=1745969 RepID=A0AAD6SUD9_9AGAR|nr:hypothetical protein C8F04DRAFT_1102068 [Mycena alexandri]
MLAPAAMHLVDSPFADRLATNYVPSDSDILKIRALLVEPEEELARLDARIDELEATLFELREKRASLKTLIDAHRALTAPIRRIPHDVLLEIFFSCLPSTHNALIDAAESPMLLGRICGTWRYVAYATPRIWSSLHIPSPSYSSFIPPHIESALHRVVAAWLERSGTCPLSISHSEGFDHWDEPFMSQILKVAHRLQHIDLSGTVESLIPFLRLGPQDLPLLQSIRINVPSETTYSLTDRMDALQVPTLHQISLDLSLDPLLLPLRWEQLTGLNLACRPVWTDDGLVGGLTSAGILAVLSRCSNLEQCRLRATARDLDLPSEPSSITLPSLHTFILEDDFLPECVFLNLFAMTEFGPGSPGDTELRADIDPEGYSQEDLVQLLRHFSRISHLRLSSRRMYTYGLVLVDEEFLAAFYSTPDTLCPMLTHIAFNTPYTPPSDAAALAFVSGRMSAGLPLQHFGADFGRPMEMDIAPHLHHFIEGGLRLSLNYVSPRIWELDPQAGLSDTLAWI